MNEQVKECVKKCIEEFKGKLGKIYYKETNGGVNGLKLLAYNSLGDEAFLIDFSNYIAKKLYEETSQIWIISLSKIDSPNPEGFTCLA